MASKSLSKAIDKASFGVNGEQELISLLFSRPFETLRRMVSLSQSVYISLTDTQQEYEDISVSAKKAAINPAICKGCGKCAATCRLKAIDPKHYDFKELRYWKTKFY